jgi:predicted GTPase
MSKRRIIIMGAAGRDFHNFNMMYRDREEYEVVAFTATQIPDIHGRKYPAALAGKLYPNGIPIYPESDLIRLINELQADEVLFSYSDVPHEYVMHRGSEVIAAGAAFSLAGSRATMVKSSKPVIAVCAVRTGSGKSQTTRKVSQILKAAGKKVAVVRHPMPYGDLVAQKVQRFATLEDLKKQHCTIEEMEEYEPHIQEGTIVYAGVDYEAILRQAETEADVVIWDGGNNDMPFYKPDLMITVADPLRPGNEETYHPGEANILMADVVVINKIDSADADDVAEVRATVRDRNPRAIIIEAASPISVEDPSIITGKRVLVVEDGPTLTHGEMSYGAGVVAAEKFGAEDLVDPRDSAVGSIIGVYEKYPNTGMLLPAMGYGAQQVRDLEATIAATDCDAVIIGTPIDLRRIIHIDKPSVRVSYELQEIGHPDLKDVMARFLK